MGSLFKKTSNIFYGWYIVFGLAFVTFLDMGARQSFGVFVHEWEMEFSTSVSSISIAASIGLVVAGLAAPFYGALIDRFGSRVILLFGAALTGFGYLLLSMIPNVFFLAFVWGCIISLTAGGISITVVTVTIARWFDKFRGIAMSVLLSGAALGGLILVPFSSYLTDIIGWRFTVVGFVLLYGLVAIPIIWNLVQNSPASIGLLPDGIGDKDSKETISRAMPPPLEVKKWRNALYSLPFWQLSLAYVVCGVSTSIISVHYVRWAISEGISSTQGALAFGVLAGVNGSVLLLVGWLSDRIERRVLLGTVYGIRAIGFLCLVVLPPAWGLWTFAIIGGGSWLSSVPLTSSLTADIYGLKQVGTLTGLTNCAHALGGGACVWIAGAVFDATGSYDNVFLGVVIGLIVAMFIAWSVQEKRFSGRYQIADTELTGAAAN